MTINLSNYEAWFLDYHEGRLDAAGQRDLFAFLESHPGLREEFDSFEAMALEIPEVRFPGREKLHRTEPGIDATTFIASHEGDLDQTGKKQLEAWLKENPGSQKEYDAYRKLKLLPDYTIVFSGKGKLKKTVGFLPVTPAVYRYAAAIALLIATWFYFRNVPAEQQVAVKQNTPAPSLSGHGDGTSAVKNNVQARTPNETPVRQGDRRKVHVPVRKNTVPGQMAPSSPLQAIRTAPATELPLQASAEPALATASMQAQPQSQAQSQPIQGTNPEPTSRERLLEVFSPSELEEMGLAQNETKKNTLWKIVEKGAEGVGKVTGADVSVSRQPDESGRTKSYQFAIGGFSISHSRAGE